MKEKKDKVDVSVALKMEEFGKTTPKVSAKGFGYLSDKILEVAKENDIPIYEDKELAESLSYLDVGMTLPPELFPAVAEIIAHIYHIAHDYKDTPISPKGKRIN